MSMLSKENKKNLKPGLYIVPTPIGHLDDITLRALQTLKSSDLILCEDTRTSGVLLKHYGIAVRLQSFHEYNESSMEDKVLKGIESGQAIALISDAGTPLISDPGFKLVRACHARNLYVTSLPGASAVTTALSLSGFPTDHFLFAGFFKDKHGEALTSIPYTLIFFVSPRQLLPTLNRLQTAMPYRDVAVVREISKLYEEVQRGTYADVIAHFTDTPPRGEIVLLLSPPLAEAPLDMHAVDRMIAEHPFTPIRELSHMLAQHFKQPKRAMYAHILKARTQIQDT